MKIYRDCVKLNVSLVIILFSTVITVSQRTDIDSSERGTRPSSCEHLKIVLDRALIDFQNSKDETAYLIIILRPGSEDGTKSVMAARISGFEKALLFRRAGPNTVVAVGQRVKGGGQAEIYVRGRVSGIVNFAANSSQICVPEKW